MDLSIIIPFYNSVAYIKKCILSCCNQDIPMCNYEIIVVDDGSTDNTKEIVLNMQKKYDNIKYIYQKNSAQGAARNNGLKQAKGKYIWFVDSDDWIEKNCLANILETLKKKNLDGVVVGHATMVGEKKKIWRSFDENKIVSGKELLSKGIFLISPTYTIWKRDYLIDNNLFFIEHLFHEDSEICPRLYYSSKRISFINTVLYYVYPNPFSTTRGTNPKRAFDIITVVRELSNFTDRIIEISVSKSLENYISEAINSSLYNTYKFNTEQTKSLDMLWYKNRDLFKHLTRSDVLKYKIEGILFKFFPYKISLIYKWLQLFNKTPGGVKKGRSKRNNFKIFSAFF